MLSSVLIAFITAYSAVLANLNHLPPEIAAHYAANLVEGYHGKILFQLFTMRYFGSIPHAIVSRRGELIFTKAL